MNSTDQNTAFAKPEKAEIAEISDACREKIQACERELNKQGFWNIALVAYQLKD